MSWRLTSIALGLASLASVVGCAAPVLTKDGQLVFQEKGASGASVITANGVEFLDKREVPRPVVRRSADEPWRPATGFLIPADGVWRRTSTPMAVQGPGLAVVLRSSDTLVPSWGGEILLRMDVIAPAQAFPHAAASIRPEERIVIIVDGSEPDIVPLATVLLDNMGAADRIGVIDATLARSVLPPLPGSHNTLLHAAIERLVAQPDRAAGASRDLTAALTMAESWHRALGIAPPPPPGPSTIPPSPAQARPPARRIVLLTDGAGASRSAAFQAQVTALMQSGIEIDAVATHELDALPSFAGARAVTGTLDDRKDALDRMIPPPGDVVLSNVTLSTSSVPAPARMVEVSGGDSALGLYADHLSLGEVYAGEARTEVMRLGLPPWVPGEPLELTVTARYRDVKTGRDETAEATLKCRYSADVEEIAHSRNGDVIAYASALAMVRRLHRAFLGSSLDKPGSVRRIASMQATSLAALARAQSDRALAVQAEVLTNLLATIDD